MNSTVPVAYIPAPPTNGFHIGPLFFHFYGLMIAVGVLCAFWLARRRWQQAGRDPAEVESPGIWAVVAGFIGGRLAYITTHTGEFRGRWLHVFAIWEGGLALYGGLTLGILTGIYVAYRRRLPVLPLLDAAIPGIPLAQAFGRWGNYFNQELFGTPSKLPWALEVDPAHRPAKYVDFNTFHPTFLYESIWDLLVVGALVWLSARRKLRTGSIVLCYLGLYAVGRFLLELIRTDTTYRLLGLSRNAYVSLLVTVGAGVWLYLRERGRPEETPVPAAVAAEGRRDGPDPAEAAAGGEGEGGGEEPVAAAADGGPAAGEGEGEDVAGEHDHDQRQDEDEEQDEDREREGEPEAAPARDHAAKGADGEHD